MRSSIEKDSLLERSESNEVPAHELSGDENAERSVLLSDIRVEKAGFILSVMTIMKTVIGVGILGLPYAVCKLGWALSLIIFTGTMLLTQYTCMLLLKVKNLSHHSNYSTIGYSVVSSKYFQTLIYFVVLFNNVGICIAELTIFKQTFKTIVRRYSQTALDEWYTQSWFTVGIVMSVVLMPLVVVKKIQKLKFLALIGIAAISIFVVTVIYNFFDRLASRDWKLPYVEAFPNTDQPFEAIASIPNIMLAFLYQMNFFPIYKGMKNSSDKKMGNASLLASLSCYFFYSLVAFLGYLTYGEEVKTTNFLLVVGRFPIENWLFLIMNLTFLLSVLCSFPIIFFGARNNFIALMKSFRNTKIQGSEYRRESSSDNIQELSEYVVNQKKQKKKLVTKILFYVLTLTLLAVIVLLAVTVGELGKIFNLVGAIASNSIGFIFPTFFYMVLVSRFRRKKNINFFASLAIFGIAVPFGIFAVVAEFLAS